MRIREDGMRWRPLVIPVVGAAVIIGAAVCWSLRHEESGPTAARPALPIDTEAKAEALVWALPEVVEWRRDIKVSGWRNVTLISMTEGRPSRRDGRLAGKWEIGVFENHPSRIHRRGTFRVDAATGNISAANLEGDEISLEKWRRTPVGD